jgi:hypothetical protein
MHRIFQPGRRGIRALRAFTLIGLMCTVAAACGTQNSPSGSPSARPSQQSPGGGKHTAALGSTCGAAQLDITLDLKSAGVAAGTSLIPIDFTNVTHKSCDLAGYAFVSFAKSSRGQQIGAMSTADRALAARQIQLGAGKTAHLWLRMVDAANLPASQCNPSTVAGLRVRLPGQGAAIYIPHKFKTCAKRVQGTDILTVEPFQAGRAHAGTAQ